MNFREWLRKRYDYVPLGSSSADLNRAAKRRWMMEVIDLGMEKLRRGDNEDRRKTKTPGMDLMLRGDVLTRLMKAAFKDHHGGRSYSEVAPFILRAFPRGKRDWIRVNKALRGGVIPDLRAFEGVIVDLELEIDAVVLRSVFITGLMTTLYRIRKVEKFKSQYEVRMLILAGQNNLCFTAIKADKHNKILIGMLGSLCSLNETEKLRWRRIRQDMEEYEERIGYARVKDDVKLNKAFLKSIPMITLMGLGFPFHYLEIHGPAVCCFSSQWSLSTLPFPRGYRNHYYSGFHRDWGYSIPSYGQESESPLRVSSRGTYVNGKRPTLKSFTFEVVNALIGTPVFANVGLLSFLIRNGDEIKDDLKDYYSISSKSNEVELSDGRLDWYKSIDLYGILSNLLLFGSNPKGFHYDFFLDRRGRIYPAGDRRLSYITSKLVRHCIVLRSSSQDLSEIGRFHLHNAIETCAEKESRWISSGSKLIDIERQEVAIARISKISWERTYTPVKFLALMSALDSGKAGLVELDIVANNMHCLSILSQDEELADICNVVHREGNWRDKKIRFRPRDFYVEFPKIVKKYCTNTSTTSIFPEKPVDAFKSLRGGKTKTGLNPLEWLNDPKEYRFANVQQMLLLEKSRLKLIFNLYLSGQSIPQLTGSIGSNVEFREELLNLNYDISDDDNGLASLEKFTTLDKLTKAQKEEGYEEDLEAYQEGLAPYAWYKNFHRPYDYGTLMKAYSLKIDVDKRKKNHTMHYRMPKLGKDKLLYLDYGDPLDYPKLTKEQYEKTLGFVPSIASIQDRRRLINISKRKSWEDVVYYRLLQAMKDLINAFEEEFETAAAYLKLLRGYAQSCAKLNAPLYIETCVGKFDLMCFEERTRELRTTVPLRYRSAKTKGKILNVSLAGYPTRKRSLVKLRKSIVHNALQAVEAHMTHKVISNLKELGIDVLTIHDSYLVSANDVETLVHVYCRELKRTLEGKLFIEFTGLASKYKPLNKRFKRFKAARKINRINTDMVGRRSPFNYTS